MIERNAYLPPCAELLARPVQCGGANASKDHNAGKGTGFTDARDGAACIAKGHKVLQPRSFQLLQNRSLTIAAPIRESAHPFCELSHSGVQEMIRRSQLLSAEPTRNIGDRQ